MSRSTSAVCYNELVKTKHFSMLQEAILVSLKKDGPATRKELASRLGKPINSVCDPVLRLVDAGKVVQYETTCFETNKRINVISLAGDTRATSVSSKTSLLISKRPSGREMLCSELLKAEIVRTDDQYETEISVNGVKFKVVIKPVDLV